MATFEPLTLGGCAPTPLASYLKALGILRLISSDANHVSGRAAEPKARGWWENERFHLRTTLNRDAVCKFFLDDYGPSPIIAPWNGRAGFLEGDAGANSSRAGAELMHAIQHSTRPRFRNMRQTIESLRSNKSVSGYDRLRATEKKLHKALKTLKGGERARTEEELKRVKVQKEDSKSLLLPTLRATTDIYHLAYIDACYVLSTDEAAAPLLGSGGNDGSRDFGVNFAECLSELFEFDQGASRAGADTQLEVALFGVGRRLNATGSMGQFTPGQGGANATTGYECYNPPLNAWDVVLAMEGTMVFAGALTRRWGATGNARAAFPFTFESVGAGAGSLSSADPNRPRGEIWTPLWHRQATFSEIAAVFAEGRLTLGRRAARTGLDAARSVARVGQSRGIRAFERYSLIQPDSKMPYQATPLGRFNSPDRPRKDLIEDLEVGDWLEQARRLAGGKSAPAHARSAMRRLDDALFQMTDANRAADGIRSALVGLGRFVDWLATTRKVRESLRPPPALSVAWSRDSDDGSPEFRVAVALAGLGLPSSRTRRADLLDVDGPSTGDAVQSLEISKAPPMAAHFAPISENSFSDGQRLRQHRRWSDSTTAPNVVWGKGGLVSNMTSVLERRLVEAAIRGLDDKPFAGATHARLSDVAGFISGNFDDARCAAFLAGLIWVRPTHLGTSRDGGPSLPVPFAYAALKLIFAPDQVLRRIGTLAETTRLPIPPGLVSRLRAGGNNLGGYATDAAVRIALARARASGVPSPFDPARAGGRAGTGKGSRIGAGLPADRLAAALLIPVGDQALRTLINRAYSGAIPEGNTESMEDTFDAA